MAARPLAAPRPTPAALHAWLAVVRAYNLCDAALATRLAELGLRVGEHEVLANLARATGLTQQQLARRCFVAKSGVSMLVSRMERDGLLRRTPDPVDARVKRLALTARGAALARRTMAIQDEVLTAMAEAIAPEEMAMVADVMHRVAERLEALAS